MKKQYVFLIMIVITLYILVLIWRFKYNEYKINSHIDYITTLNKEIETKIVKATEIIEYKTSAAYKNKILKEQQWFKNRWEKVIYLTSEDKYNKFTKEIEEYREEVKEIIETENNNNTDTKEMTIFQKWIYFLFNKDISI